MKRRKTSKTSYIDLHAKARADLERWLDKLVRVTRKVEDIRKRVKYLAPKAAQENAQLTVSRLGDDEPKRVKS